MEFKTLVEALKPFFSTQSSFNRGRSYKEKMAFSYYDDLLSIDAEYPENKSLTIEFRHVEMFNSELAEELLNNPTEWLKAATSAISDLIFPFNELKDISIRVVGLPVVYEIPISKLRNQHLEKFISIRCVISKATEVRPAYEVCAFQCMRCGYVTDVPQSKDSDLLQEPFAGCENDTCGKKGPFKKLDSQSITYNHQYMKVQEPLENLRGRQPEFLHVSCSDDLAGISKPGEKVIITGVLKGRLKVKKEGVTKFLDFLFVANSIQKSDRDFENIIITSKEEEKIKELSKSNDLRELIISSIAPSIYGLENIKEGIALQLFSGVRREYNDGTHKRGDIHILMVGDPGVAKSQFLDFVSFFAPRAIKVSGRSTSAAGLTGAAVHDEFDGRWSIEAGAMTMAGEGGVCCVDEVDKMSPKDRASIHTALEQQAVDIAKAGIYAHMPTICSFLGAANPKYGRYDTYESISSQFNLGDALLSRMDLLYVLKDEANAQLDERVAWHVLDGDDDDERPVMDLEFLRKYIAYAKTHYNPKMGEDAKEYIKNFYVETRKSAGGRDSVPITVRFLESAKRLAAAQAKMRLSDKIEKIDAEAAVRLLLDNLNKVGIDPDTGKLDSTITISGVSYSQRQKIKDIKDIIKNLSSKNIKDGTARLNDIITECEKIGIGEPETLLKRLSEKRDIIFINQNFIKLTSSY